MITDQSSDKVADAILDAMDRYNKNMIQDNYVDQFMERFSRESLTIKLMNIIAEKIPLTGKNVENSQCRRR